MTTVYYVYYRDPEDYSSRVDKVYPTREQAEQHALQAPTAEGSKGLEFYVVEKNIECAA